MSFWSRLGEGFATGGLSELGGARPLLDKASPGLLKRFVTSPDAEIESQRKRLLQQQAASAGRFADEAQGNYQALGQRGYGALNDLQAQAQGANSVSALQLRQALQQSQAQQQSLAAGAAPQNAAMAARTAAIQSARLGSGLAGQQALAGLQERNQAQQQYAGLLTGLRGQDAQSALGSRQTATAGYGAANAGTPAPSLLQQYGPAIESGAKIAAMSDRRLKTDIKDGTSEALRAIGRIEPSTFRYKNPSVDGAGPRLGVMAQNLERAGLGDVVIDTPRGKAVDGAQLALKNTAMIAALARQQRGDDGAGRVATPIPTSLWYAREPDLAAIAEQQRLLRRRALLRAIADDRGYAGGDTQTASTYSTDAGGQ